MVAFGQLAVVSKVSSSDEIIVKSIGTGQLQTVAIAEIETIPERPSEITQLSTYDPADPREALQLIAAAERAVILREYLEGRLRFDEAAKKLSLKKSALYGLIARFSPTLGALSIIKQPSGPKNGRRRISDQVFKIVEASFKEHYKGESASYSHVWKQVQSACNAAGQPSPGLSTVQRLIKAMDPKLVFRQKHGLDATNQRFQTRPGYVHTDYPLQHAQIDHTLVDIILRAEHDRSLIIGRPWVTLLIDVHTRVILGFYLSMFSPSLIAVQQTVCMAALPKNRDTGSSSTYGINYPYYGMPENLGMDNAKEFHSMILVAALRKYGCEPKWRKIGKKHMGGTIESLIGTLMTTAVHFLPGTTFSNVKQRGDYDSEKKSALTFKEFCSWFAGQILIYHGTVHSELRVSPKEMWEKYYSETTKALPPVIVNKRNLYLDFLPERHKPVRNNGITLNAGIYYSSELAQRQGKGKITIKFDPHDMSSIWAKSHDDYISVPLIRSTHDFINYEFYRANRAYNKQTPPGTVTDPEALLQIAKNNELVSSSRRSTAKSQRETQKAEAKSQHRYRFRNGVPKQLATNSVTVHSESAKIDVQVNFSMPPKLFDIKD